jgi:hypothetical protein
VEIHIGEGPFAEKIDGHIGEVGELRRWCQDGNPAGIDDGQETLPEDGRSFEAIGGGWRTVREAPGLMKQLAGEEHKAVDGEVVPADETDEVVRAMVEPAFPAQCGGRTKAVIPVPRVTGDHVESGIAGGQGAMVRRNVRLSRCLVQTSRPML